MKKLLIFFAALLPCFLAYSQEAEETGSYAEFQIIPRFDYNPYFFLRQSGDGSSGNDFTFGNSSIYTLIEGQFSEHVSFLINNHWLAGDKSWDATKALYGSTLYSNSNNWVDLAYVDFNFGNWSFRLGKDCISSGGFEYDDYDVNVDYLSTASEGEQKILLASNLWYNLPGYQWGARAAYSIQDHTTLSFQMITSPFGERPFASGLYAYSLRWDGNYGNLSNIWTGSAIQRQDGGFEWLVALSQRYALGDFTLGFDWYNTVDIDWGPEGEAPLDLLKGNTFRPSLQWTPSEKFDCCLIGNVYTRFGLYDLNAGAWFHYYPIKNIQLHAAAAWDYFTNSISALVGLKVDLTVLSL